ncbi:MAG: hypothetical protein IKT78_00610 [Ruminiclostridium sp.]|nr:hypothetical protein [Ruminiclostridium sp.]
MDRNKLKVILGAGTALSLCVGIVLFVLSLALSMHVFPKVMLILVAVVALALAVELGYFTYLMMDKKPNYFLYNSQTRHNISVQKLTFQTINSRMNRFLSGYASSEGKIWNARVLDNPYLEMPQEFKPLVAYKLLYGLAEKDADAGWECLENASEETLLFIYNGISMNNDKDFAFNFAQLTQRPMNIKLVRDYLIRNKRYMQGKMTKYVVENIDKF